MKRRIPLHCVLIYATIIAFIGTWWTLALQMEEGTYIDFQVRSHADMQEFSEINRDELRDALGGDTDKMIRFIEAWDIEAQQTNGLRLTSQEFRQAHLLRHQIRKSNDRFFPQTFAAASIMLALADPEQIVALPKGLRRHSDLFPEKITSLIPHDAHRFNTELLFRAKPRAAFVAAYSDPGTLYSLKQQKIPTVILSDANTIDGIIESIAQIGALTGNSAKAELLILFMKASFHALDNRTEWLHKSNQMPCFLCTIEMNGLKLPTKRTLTGQILDRMGVDTVDEACWSVPVTKEYIKHKKPEMIIVASGKPGIRNIPYNVQMFPTQHIVLAYYDILHAITL